MGHFRNRLLWGGPLLAAGWLALTTALIAQTTLRTGRYEPVLISLQSAKTYANPYLEVELSATFTGPGGEELVLEGFWDGDRTWKLRFAPTAVGTWRYRTTSNDTGLVRQGTITCETSAQHGPVRVNPARPYTFLHADGTPFFWMGETSWRLFGPDVFTSNNGSPVDRSFDTFKAYVDRRAVQRFNHIHCVVDNNVNEGGATFINQDKNRLNPLFFQGVDRRVEYMHQRGVGVELVFTWAQQFVEYTRPQFERYARYLVARYAAYPVVIWNLSGEYNEAGAISDYDYIGAVVRARDPYGHPIAIHPGGDGSSRDFVNAAWNSLVMQQRFESDGTIALSDLLAQLGRTDVVVRANMPTVTITVPDQLHADILADRRYNKPVVNAEFGYEQYDGRTGRDNRTTPEAVRKLAWGIVMAGGYFCYGMEATYREYFNLPAMELGGGEYMRHLYEFMTATDFAALDPHDELVPSPAMCLANPGREYVIYFPVHQTLDLVLPSGRYLASWFDPARGVRAPDFEVNGGSALRFTPPAAGDMVLHLKRTIPETSRLLIHPATLTLARGLSWRLQARALTATGDTVVVQPAWSTTGGSIDSSGRYTAPVYDGVFEVRATLGALTATARITVAGLLFTDRTAQRGFSPDEDFGGWHGTYVCDYDNDGDEDLFMTSHGRGLLNDTGRNALWRNRGNGTFDEVARSAGVDGGLHGRYSRELHGASWLDYDNDGDFDLFMPNTDSEANNTAWHAVDELYRNNGNGTFTKLSGIGLSTEDFNRRGACVADFNRDGHLDIFVASMVYWRNNRNEAPKPYRALYLNQGNGTFVLETRGIDWINWVEGCTTLDYDQDGNVDVLVADEGSGGGLQLWRNRGQAQFERALFNGLPVNGNFNGSVCAADFNGDGATDLYAARSSGAGQLYLNNGNGTFRTGQQFGGAEHMIAADLDNDGDLDLISGGVYLNDGTGVFEQVETGLAAEGRGGMAFDADEDGDLDVIMNRSDRQAPYLRFYENNLRAGKWLKLKLISPSGGIGAPGARIWIHEDTPNPSSGSLLAYREVVTATGFVSGPPSVQHFGLGDRTRVAVRVRFVTGEEVTVGAAAAGQTLVIDGRGAASALEARILAKPTRGCSPLTVRFDGSQSRAGAASITSYHWDFGDGTSANGSKHNHVYRQPGIYTASLRVEDDLDRSAQTSITISVFGDIRVPLVVEVLAPRGYPTRKLQVGERYYADRDYRLLRLPEDLAQAEWILTANEDKNRTEEAWLRFRINRAARVYVAYDQRATALPLWLRTYQATGQQVAVGDEATQLVLYCRDFDTGEITLGGNLATGAAGTWSNYAVAVKALPCGDPDPTTGEIPLMYELGHSYPNPTIMAQEDSGRPVTHFRFRLAEGGEVKLAIYDLLGRLVRILVQEERAAGEHLAMWDGRDQNGYRVGSGIYFYRLECNGFAATQRLLLLGK